MKPARAGLVPLRVKRRRKISDSAKRKIKNDPELIPRSPPPKKNQTQKLHRYDPHGLGYFCGISFSLARMNRRTW